MESALEADNPYFAAIGLSLVAISSHELDRSLICFGARVTDEDFGIDSAA